MVLAKNGILNLKFHNPTDIDEDKYMWKTILNLYGDTN